MKKLFFVESWKGILLHLIIIIALVFGLIFWFFFLYLPSTTNHDYKIIVPNLENMDVNKAVHFLESKDLNYVVQDTTFSLKHKLGAVVNQQPKAGSEVKSNRHIYITINRTDFPVVVLDNNKLSKIRRTSLMQAQHEIPLLGFSVGKIIEVPGFKDFVTECVVNGDTLKMDSTINLQIHTIIDLVVGNGEEDKVSISDSLELDNSIDLDGIPSTEVDTDLP